MRSRPCASSAPRPASFSTPVASRRKGAGTGILRIPRKPGSGAPRDPGRARSLPPDPPARNSCRCERPVPALFPRAGRRERKPPSHRCVPHPLPDSSGNPPEARSPDDTRMAWERIFWAGAASSGGACRAWRRFATAKPSLPPSMLHAAKAICKPVKPQTRQSGV